MSNKLKNSWRWRHARKLRRTLFLSGVTFLVSILLESLIFKNLPIIASLSIFLIFILISSTRLYLQYRQLCALYDNLPVGAKSKMINHIRILEHVMPFILLGGIVIVITYAFCILLSL